MYDPVIRLQLQVFASDVKSTAFAIRPLVTELAAWLSLIDAYGHRPSFRSKQPYPLLRDRKSTRLNSSHTVISYAVFCLKKKKNEDTHTAAVHERRSCHVYTHSRQS